MLKKTNRLHTRYEFNKVRRFGIVYNSPLFSLYVLKPNNYHGSTRVGFIISNKFHKSAVIRNRVKRVFREAIMNNLPNIQEDLWISIYPRTSVLSLDSQYEKVNFEIIKAIQNLHISR